ncbi:MAG: penicillin-binding protein 2 [Verrucomicrobiota bacterium]|nr:penicillin-binding protein 2 [Verrucomicrobiota bacterium]
MLVFDQLRKEDRKLRWIAVGVLFGLLILLGGLWQVQVFARKEYEQDLKVQAFRKVRVPSARGKILDRNGELLAENQPRFVVNLYLEDLRSIFRQQYNHTVTNATFLAEKGGKLTRADRSRLSADVRYQVVSNIVWQVSSMILPQPLVLQARAFSRHYNESLALPLPVLANLTPEQVALFMERGGENPGVQLEVQPVRHYPNESLAVHLLGYVQREIIHETDEEIAFEDKIPDLVGKAGLEAMFDAELRGTPGYRSILVNNLGYRHKEEIWSDPEPGLNLALTLDINVQKTAEAALRSTGANTRGAAVVLDVRNGDILAMASSPTFDPNQFLYGISHEAWAEINDPKLKPQLNRATHGAYAPGSVFKIVTGLAFLEADLVDPMQEIFAPGYYQLGRRRIDDLAPPGNYNFKNAFKKSSNFYFIEYGLRAGPQKIIEMGNRFHLGEKTGALSPRQEQAGYFPAVGQKYKKDGSRWLDGDTANLCIGQGELTLTPIQVAVMTAAIANGGKVFKPRLVTALLDEGQQTTVKKFPSEVVNDLQVSKANLDIVRAAMLADVEEKGGTGEKAYVPGMNVCGKTGTAQVRVAKGMDHITWFASFAPFEAPRYAVVVMIESGSSGGGTCAPMAREIYKTLQKIESGTAPLKRDQIAVLPSPLQRREN